MVCLALALAPSCAALSCSRILSAPKMWLKGQFPQTLDRQREMMIYHMFFCEKKCNSELISECLLWKEGFLRYSHVFEDDKSFNSLNFRSMRSQRMGYKKEITIPKVPLTFQAWYHENGWFWFAGKSTRDTFFSANQLNKSPLENPRFCDTSRMEFDRWSICYAVVEMSELCDDHACSVNLRVIEMMGDDPNIINVWWADKQMNDDQHPAISGYWLTWSFTKPLYSWLRKVLCFFRRFWVKKSLRVTLQGAHLSTKNACTTWHHLSNLQQARVVQKQNKVWSDQKAATRQVFPKILDKLVKCMN